MTTYSKILEKVARIEMRIAEHGGTGQLTVFTLQEVRVLLAEIERLRSWTEIQIKTAETRAGITPINADHDLGCVFRYGAWSDEPPPICNCPGYRATLAMQDETRTNKINDGLEAMQERDREQS